VNITGEQLAFRLNQILAVDRHALQELCAQQVPCNEALAQHPTVQVRVGDGRLLPNGAYRLSVIGLLNGLLPESAETGKFLMAIYQGGRLVEFYYGTTGEV
jgi:hypothetical protein